MPERMMNSCKNSNLIHSCHKCDHRFRHWEKSNCNTICSSCESCPTDIQGNVEVGTRLPDKAITAREMREALKLNSDLVYTTHLNKDGFLVFSNWDVK